jgi:hypothetical protein
VRAKGNIKDAEKQTYDLTGQWIIQDFEKCSCSILSALPMDNMRSSIFGLQLSVSRVLALGQWRTKENLEKIRGKVNITNTT